MTDPTIGCVYRPIDPLSHIVKDSTVFKKL